MSPNGQNGTKRAKGQSLQGKGKRGVRKKLESLTSDTGFFDLFMSQLPGLVSIIDSNQRVLYINKYYEELSEKKTDAYLGKHFSNVFDKDIELEVKERDQEELKDEDPDKEIEELRIGGRTVTFLTKTFPILKEGSPILEGRISLDITKRKQIYTELKDRERQVRNLSSRLSDAHEEVRKRIAMELHDGVASSLNAIKLSLERNLNDREEKTDYPAPTLEEIVSMVEKTNDEVRRIMGELRPSMLDDLGIIPTISACCRELETIYPAFTVEKQIRIEEDEIPERLKIVLFRIVQEALTNAGKHSDGDTVSISLKRIGGSLVLAIRDNGQGFPPMRQSSSKISTRLGIFGMDERTSLSGGTFSIDSEEGKGTTVTAVWPLDR
jgi:PAS domain S-box-containing protein